MRSSLRLAAALLIAVLSSGLLIAAAPPPAGAHDVFACAGITTGVGDWCAQRRP